MGVTYSVLAGYGYATEGLENRRIRRAFDHYLAPSLVDRLAENPSALKLGGEQRTITVMFADLTGFTAASTEMTPDALTGKVNRYFDFIVRPIDATGGYVERFLGDSSLAFWNAPLADPRHAVNAVRAAFDVVEGVRHAREEDEARGEKGFTIKVGINTGPAVVGNIGSKDRFVHGDGRGRESGGAIGERPASIRMPDRNRREHGATRSRRIPDARARLDSGKGGV